MTTTETGHAATGTSARTRVAIASTVGAGALLALVVLILATGSAPQPLPGGLPDPGPVVVCALPISRLAADVFATVTVGFLLVAVVLLPSGNRL